ncbi:hypothetical protein AB0J04_11675, partial [Streptomyces sp. NPDC050263]
MAMTPSAPYLMPGDGDLPRAHVSWWQRAGRAAVLVHDMQRCFLRPFSDGQSPLTELVADVDKLLVAARAGGGTSSSSAGTSAAAGNVRPVATPGTHSRRTGRKPKYVQYE